eukprot:3270827-Amphidinium_carterae.1
MRLAIEPLPTKEHVREPDNKCSAQYIRSYLRGQAPKERQLVNPAATGEVFSVGRLNMANT